MNRTKNARVCIIGAGPSGITAGKNLIQAGVTNFVIYEKNDQVGGNWVFNDKTKHSSVYETTHLISSRRYSEYFDYPMPADYPDYPSHTQMLAYFQGYAKHFGVMPYIQFNTEVHNAEELPDKTWRITL
ncbi:MAG TPA: NAD(P)-binding domain-containing protein, partial [Anaerolineales bacterium]|nr:NAD(P)-binding domain-containing protein [Anaerolineales bacterium]